MSKLNDAESPSISRVQAVIYAPALSAGGQQDAITLCERWAAIHDWHVTAVVRETSGASMPSERVGIRILLDHLATHQGTIALAASRSHIADDLRAFHEVCSQAEHFGGFLHVLGDPKETPDAP